MTAKEILSRLQEGEWVNQLCSSYFPFIKKMRTPPKTSIYSEVTIRIETGEKTRFDKPKPQRRRFDAIVLIKPHYKAYGNECLVVGVEIKVSEADLLQDKKYTDYLGYTDFMFFAVPAKLLDSALDKASQHDNIGVISTTSLTIHKMPTRQTVPQENFEELFRQILFTKIEAEEGESDDINRNNLF